DIHAFLAGHRRRRATATIATCEVETRVESGVIETDAGGRVRAYVEKPTQRHRVSMGAYLFEPRVRDFIPSGRPLDIPQLIARLLEAGEPVAAHHHDGYWLDIGRPEDY